MHILWNFWPEFSTSALRICRADSVKCLRYSANVISNHGPLRHDIADVQSHASVSSGEPGMLPLGCRALLMRVIGWRVDNTPCSLKIDRINQFWYADLQIWDVRIDESEKMLPIIGLIFNISGSEDIYPVGDWGLNPPIAIIKAGRWTGWNDESTNMWLLSTKGLPCKAQGRHDCKQVTAFGSYGIT